LVPGAKGFVPGVKGLVPGAKGLTFLLSFYRPVAGLRAFFPEYHDIKMIHIAIIFTGINLNMVPG
jgi:hypothetical protein